MNENYPFSEFMKIKLTSISENSAEGELRYDKNLSDMLGHMTGAAYNALCDAVGGACARATGDMYVTQNCSMQYYVSTEAEDEMLFAKAVLRHRGSRTCIVDVELTHKDGVIAADGQFSYSKL